MSSDLRFDGLDGWPPSPFCGAPSPIMRTLLLHPCQDSAAHRGPRASNCLGNWGSQDQRSFRTRLGQHLLSSVRPSASTTRLCKEHCCQPRTARGNFFSTTASTACLAVQSCALLLSAPQVGVFVVTPTTMRSAPGSSYNVPLVLQVRTALASSVSVASRRPDDANCRPVLLQLSKVKFPRS